MFLPVVPTKNGSNGVSVAAAMTARLNRVRQDGGGKRGRGMVAAGEVVAQGQRRALADGLGCLYAAPSRSRQVASPKSCQDVPCSTRPALRLYRGEAELFWVRHCSALRSPHSQLTLSICHIVLAVQHCTTACRP